MADIAYFHTRIPLSGDGVVDITISVKDIGAASDADRQFVLAVLDKATAFAAANATQQAANPELPSVLRGVGRRA